MFDLTKALTSKTKSTSENNTGVVGATFFYQSLECLNLIKETFQFEGWEEPDCKKLTLKLDKLTDKLNNHIVILELNESDDIVEDAKIFSTKLPTHKGVIVIGKENAISTLRSLKDMGFYYVFWPIHKHEFADFLINVSNNLKTFSGVSNKRKAKRVAIVGAKGGVGCSLITSELSSTLSSKTIDTIMVDHQYFDSNIDVLLTLENYKPKTIDEFTIPLHEMDEEGALSYLYSARNNLRLLAINGDMDQSDILSYNLNICNHLLRNTNFIIEDFSRSINFKIDPHLLVDNFDVVVIISDPSIASIRNTRLLTEKITNLHLTLSGRTRIITVMNYHRPRNTFVVKSIDFKKYLGVDVDLEINFCPQLAHIIIDGKRAHKHDRHISRSMERLVRLINGQPLAKPSLFDSFKKKVIK